MPACNLPQNANAFALSAEVRLLLDENLSPALVPALDSVFPGTVHVRDIGLLGATDAAIWSFALENNYCIVSRDANFFERARLIRPAPRLIFIQGGNRSTRALIERLAQQDIADHFKDPAIACIVVS